MEHKEEVNDSGQILSVSPEAPLMEFRAMNTGKWQEVDHVKKPYIYSYVLNNYWDTNENPLRNVTGQFRFNPYEVKFLLLKRIA